MNSFQTHFCSGVLWRVFPCVFSIRGTNKVKIQLKDNFGSQERAQNNLKNKMKTAGIYCSLEEVHQNVPKEHFRTRVDMDV